KVDKTNPNQIGASMPGTVVKKLVEKGEKVKKGDHLMITEAMKMETTVQAPFDGEVKNVHVSDGDTIESGDLLIELEN
ncbi:biotin/lipoyl-containing protein, partial [Alteribacillus sp. JSM 102045]